MAGAGFPSQGFSTPPRQSAVVFVDGASMRSVLAKTLPGFDSRTSRIPACRQWHDLFDTLAARACRHGTAPILRRVYWYAPGTIHYLGEENQDPAEIEKRRAVARKEMEDLRRNLQALSRGTDDLEVIHTGLLKYHVFRKEGPGWGKEKGVDVAVAVEMLSRAHMYEVAVLISRDADLAPAVKAAKDLGKTVAIPYFTDDSGLPLVNHSRTLLDSADRVIPVSSADFKTIAGQM